jgi:hypothetical protein
MEVPLRFLRIAVGASTASLVALWLARPWVAGDTPFVWDGTDAFVDCLADGDFVACRHRDELDYWGLTSPIGDWPLLQHIPDLVVLGVGGQAHHTRELVFANLGVTGIVASIVLARGVLTRIGHGPWLWGFLVVLLSGPLIAYARTTAGEGLATGLLVAFVAATMLPAPPALTALATVAASLTKETSYPFLAVLGIAGLLLSRQRTGRPIRRELIWGAGGLGAGFVLASLFNVVRFGSPLNTNYLKPELHTAGLRQPLEYALALLVSPNGGILVFWLSASVLLAVACALPLVRSGSHLDLVPALVLLAVVVGLILGFASWWDPFGSIYGPRFLLPWGPPLVLLALGAYGRQLAALAGRLLRPAWRLLVVFVAIFVLALPHVGQIWRPQAPAEFAKAHGCDVPWRGFDEFHACQHERMWFGKPLPLYSLEGVATRGGLVTSVALGVALLGSLLLLRAELRARRMPESVRSDA